MLVYGRQLVQIVLVSSAVTHWFTVVNWSKLYLFSSTSWNSVGLWFCFGIFVFQNRNQSCMCRCIFINKVGFQEVDVSKVYNLLTEVVDSWVTASWLYSILSSVREAGAKGLFLLFSWHLYQSLPQWLVIVVELANLIGGSSYAAAIHPF